MDYFAFIRACMGNPTQEQIVAASKQAAKMLKDQFGAAAVQNMLRNAFGEDVVPQPQDYTAEREQIAALKTQVDALAARFA